MRENNRTLGVGIVGAPARLGLHDTLAANPREAKGQPPKALSEGTPLKTRPCARGLLVRYIS